MSFHKCKGIKVIRDLAEVSWPGKRTPPGLLGNRAKWKHKGPTGDYWSWGFTEAGSAPLGCLVTSRHFLVLPREWASSLSQQSPPISHVQTTRETWDWVLSLACLATPLPSTTARISADRWGALQLEKSSFSPAATPTWPDFLFILS